MEDEDFKTGMRVIYRNGWRGIVVADIGIFTLEGGGHNLINQHKKSGRSWEIVEVYEAPTVSSFLNFDVRGEMIWSEKDREALESIRLLDRQIAEISEQLKAITESRNSIRETLSASKKRV